MAKQCSSPTDQPTSCIGAAEERHFDKAAATTNLVITSSSCSRILKCICGPSANGSQI